jgi:hypothetical protein
MSAIDLETTSDPLEPTPRHRGWLVAVAFAAVISLGALISVWIVGGRGVALALSFTRGQSSSYAMTMTVQGTMDAAGQSIPYDLAMSGTVQLRVISVSADGVAEVQEVFSDVQMTSGGKPVDVPADLPSPVLHITTDGRVIASSGVTLFGGGGTQGPTQIGQDGLSAVLSEEAVNLGDVWTTTVTQTILGTPVTYLARGVYLRDEPVAGVETAVVRTTALVPLDLTVRATDVAALVGVPADQLPAGASFTYAGRQHVTRTSWIDADASALVKTTSQGDYSMTMSGQGLPEGSLPPGGLTMQGIVTMTLERG